MINDFQAAFRISKIRKALIICWFTLSIISVWVYFWGATRWGLLAALTLAAAWAWREPHTIRHLMVDDDYQAWLLPSHQPDELIEAELLSGSLIHRWGCFLKWRCDNRVIWQLVLPDMLDADTFRRLRVWATFGQKQ